MSPLVLLITLCVTFFSPCGVNAVPAPPVTSVKFQNNQQAGSFTGCISVDQEAEGSLLSVVSCEETFPSAYSWSVVNGGSTSGTGPASQIRIFGNLCLDNTNGVTTNGNLLQIWTCTAGDANQLWNVNSDSTITLAGTNKCVDLTNGVLEPGTHLQLWDCSSGDVNQQWIPQIAPLITNDIEWEGNENSGLCLGITSFTNNAPVSVQPCGSTTWLLPPSGYGQLQISGPGDLCLDVTNGVNEDGTKLQVFACATGNSNQIWEFEPDFNVPVGWVGTTKCVDLTNGEASVGNQIQIWNCSSGDGNQMWDTSVTF